MQNAGAEYLGPFFGKKWGRLPGWADYLPGGAEYLGTAKSGGRPKTMSHNATRLTRITTQQYKYSLLPPLTGAAESTIRIASDQILLQPSARTLCLCGGRAWRSAQRGHETHLSNVMRGRRAGRKTRKIPGNLPHFWPRPGILPLFSILIWYSAPHFWQCPGILPHQEGNLPTQVICPTFAKK